MWKTVLVVVGECASQPTSSSTDTAFIAFGSSASTVTLAWEATPGATAYKIERKPAGGSYAPVATVAGTDYLDTGLDAQTVYTYRVSAVDAKAEHEHTAITTDSPPLVTGDPIPSGAPIVQVIGSAGGTIIIPDPQAEVAIPPGAVPDGTMITVQPIVGPIAENATLGLELDVPAGLTQPVEVVFALDAGDLLAPEDTVIAVQQDDGTWVAQHRTVDTSAGTATATLGAPVVPGARLVPGAPNKLRVTRLQATWIVPMTADVEVNKTLQLHAFGVFSDLPCQVAPGASPDWFCLGVAAGALKVGLADPAELARPLNNEQTLELHNTWPGYQRTWTVENVSLGSSALGTITIPTNMGGTYMAPAVKPSKNPVAVRFESTQDPSSAPDGFAFHARSRPSLLTITGGMGFHVSARFSDTSGLEACPIAQSMIVDGFDFDLAQDSSGELHVVGVTNQVTTYSALVYDTGVLQSVVEDVPPEIITVLDGTVTSLPMTQYAMVTLNATETAGQCTGTYVGGMTMSFTASTLPPIMISFDTMTNQTQGDYGAWTVTVTPK